MVLQGEAGAGEPGVGERFRAEAWRRIDQFYGELARLGEVPPARRFALEGFLAAGLYLELVERELLQRWLHDSQRGHLGAELPAPPTWADGAGVTLPVRWQRAPVYPGGKS